jgi:hypothetical protein
MSAISERIAEGLRTGFPHPVEPERQPPILTAAFRSAGMNPEMAEAVNDASMMLAEAIEAVILTDHAIIPRTELTRLQQDSAAPAQSVAVHCRCDTGRQDPLIILGVRGPTAVVDGRALLRALHQRPDDCPHR